MHFLTALFDFLAVVLAIWGIGWAMENGPAIAPIVYVGCALMLSWVLGPPFLRRLSSEWRR